VEKKLSEKLIIKMVFDTLLQWKIRILRRGLNTPVSNLLFRVVSKKVSIW